MFRLIVLLMILVATSFGATVRSNTTTQVVQWCTDGLPSTLCNPPDNVGETVKFDEETNPTLLNTIRDNAPEFTIVGGVLLRNGSPVAINANGPLNVSLADAKQVWNSIKTQAAFDALTAAQKAEALRRANKMIILLLVKEGILSPQDFQ